MFLHFETELESNTPVLQDANSITPDTVIQGVRVDGSSVDIHQQTIGSFCEAVAKFNTEILEPKHFRDCNCFVMAMCGVWMPTHPLFARDFSMEVDCQDDTTSNSSDCLGPVAIGIPNDERCLGFGDKSFVYCHSVFGVESSIGTLCFSKLGVEEKYSLSTFEAMLELYESEVAHIINSLSVKNNDKEVFRWNRQED